MFYTVLDLTYKSTNQKWHLTNKKFVKTKKQNSKIKMTAINK